MELPEGARGEETSYGEMHTFLPKLKPGACRDLQTGAHTHPTPLGFIPVSCLVPLPNSVPLSNGSPPGQPAVPESKLALQQTDVGEFGTIQYKGGGKRRLPFPVPLLPLEWVIPKSLGGANHIKTRLDICPLPEAAYRAPGK